jgi:hypothetical protein
MAVNYDRNSVYRTGHGRKWRQKQKLLKNVSNIFFLEEAEHSEGQGQVITEREAWSLPGGERGVKEGWERGW